MRTKFMTTFLFAGVLCFSATTLGQVQPYGVKQPIALIDSTGAQWAVSEGELVKKVPTGAASEQLTAAFVGEGIRIENSKGMALIPIEGRSTGFYGKPSDRNTVLKLIRHYDGKVSLMSQDGKVLFVDSDQTIRREKMAKIKKSAIFTMYSATNLGARLPSDVFDCSPARMKEIRKRYGKVANNKKLKSRVVSNKGEHEYYESTTHRFYKGTLAEEHIRSGFSSADFNRYTYFWQSDRSYFEYDVEYSHGPGIKTEIRRYSSGQGTLCRCLFRDIEDGYPAGPQFQRACQSPSMERKPARSWE